MPIYEYRCSSCGFEEEYLQKVGAALLTDCPECGKATFAKKLTAAGFQLKGSGWYATDFKNSGKAKNSKADSKSDTESVTKSETKSEGSAETKTETKSETKAADKPAASSTSSTDSTSSKA
jgi:putative FmdB family regulatory protein